MLKLKNSILKIVMIMLVIVALAIPTTAYATNGSVTVITPGGTTTPTPSTPTPSATNTPKPTTTPSTTTKLPQTGIEDYTGLIFVTIVLAGSAVFAYKKMKDYENI